MPKVDAVAERAAKLVEALRKQRDEEGADYPLTLAELRELAEPGASDEEVLKAVAKKPYAEQVVLANRKDPASPIALAEDAEELAGSDLVLDYVLEKTCSADKPLAPVSKLAGALDKTLREPFEQALTKLVESDSLPEGIGKREGKKGPELYSEKFPPPPPVPSPAKELAGRLVAGVREQKEQGGTAYPTTLARLTELVGSDTPGGLLKKALAEEDFRSAVVTVPVSKAETLVALAEDRAGLLTGLPLLEKLLAANTSAKKPYITPPALAELLPEDMQEAFVESVDQRVDARDLGELIDFRHAEEGDEVELYLKEYVPDRVVLAEKLVQTLEEMSEVGDEKYPPTLAALLHQAAPQASPELVEQALKEKAFKDKVVQAVPGNADTPVALAEDAEALAQSPKLLEFAVGLVSNADEPLHPVKAVAGKLDRSLQKAFTEALEKRAGANDWPQEVGAEEVKGKLHLHLRRYPPPRDPAEELAKKLVEGLRSRRERGEYPVAFGELLKEAGGDTDEKVLKSALAKEPYAKEVLAAQPGEPEGLVVLVEDREQLLGDGRLLEQVLVATRTADNQAVPVAELAKKLSRELQKPFTEAVEEQAESGKLPPVVGALRIKGKPHLFLTADVGAPAPRAASAEAPKAAPAPIRDEEERRLERPPQPAQATEPGEGDLARQLDEAFD